MPILLMAVLFGLAMDYEVFLVSGMREEFVKTGDARHAVSRGFANGSRVVTAAALIMFFVFFAFVPDGSGTIKPIALGLAVGIAFDAFLVRMTLIPALMTLLGRAAWWMPKWLARILPNMDIEGEQLREHQHAVAWARTQGGAALSAEAMVAGSDEQPVGPLTFGAAAGSLVLVAGNPADRRVLAATLAGRLRPVSGNAQLAGHPLPSESATVSRLVALAEVAGLDRAESEITLGEILTERLRITQPWYRALFVRRRAVRWIDGANSALAAVGSDIRLHEETRLQQLPMLERAVALAMVAIAERTPVIMLDQLDPFSDDADDEAFVAAVCSLADRETTIVLGRPLSAHAHGASLDGRTVVTIDLRTLTTTPDAREALQ
jgi:RND superfamily putative drug exporter